MRTERKQVEDSVVAAQKKKVCGPRRRTCPHVRARRELTSLGCAASILPLSTTAVSRLASLTNGAIHNRLPATPTTKVTATENVIKKEKKYHTSCKDSDRMQREVNDMKVGGATAKEFDKVAQKARKAKEAVLSSQEAYKDAVKLLDDTRRSWERDMVST